MRRSRQRGAMAILAGLMAAVLVGFGGIAIDLGRLYVTRTEVQSAMDSCALAAANQLMPGTGATNFVLEAATAHGRATVDSTRQPLSGSRPATSVNRGYFQSVDIVAANVAVTFSDTLAGTYAAAGTASPVTARFARCDYPLPNVTLFLLPTLNLIGGNVPAATTVSARAIASRAPGTTGDPTNSTTCGVFPIAVCMTAGGSAATNWGLTPGQWIRGPVSTGGGGGGGSSSIGPGNYGWVDFTPPAGGASELGGLLSGQGQCGAIPIGTQVGQPGSISSAYPDWNTRFGLYANGGGSSLTSAPPDFTGHAYTYVNYPAAVSAFPNGAVNAYRNDYMARRASNAVFGSAAAGFANNNFNATTFSTSAQYAQYGRLRRLVVAPVVNCSLFSGGSSQPPISGYACVFLLRPYPTSGPTPGANSTPTAGVPGSFSAYNSPEIEYVGNLADPDTPCRLSGAPGGGGGGGGTNAGLVPRLVQ